MCPLGAFAIYFHYLYDEYRLLEKRPINFQLNKDWRTVSSSYSCRSIQSNTCVGASPPRIDPRCTIQRTMPIQSHCASLQTSIVCLKIQAALCSACPWLSPNGYGVYFFHLLNTYRLLTVVSRVDANETAKLGWSRGTYIDTYAPAIPKAVGHLVLYIMGRVSKHLLGYSCSARVQGT